MAYALDLGTTNSGLARWNDARPELLKLPTIQRNPDSNDPLHAPRMVPSAVHVFEERGFWDKLGARPWWTRRTLLGRQAWIGREAIDRNQGVPSAAFAQSFKRYLGTASLKVLAQSNGRNYTARDVARLFMRELVVETKRVTGERIRELTVTAPVDAYEAYRAEVSRIAADVGIERVKIVDEPVAAALGYGLGLERERRVLVVDFGGGTLDLALVEISARSAEQGTGRVLAKVGRPIGGDLVDHWLLSSLRDPLGVALPAPDSARQVEVFWYQQLLAEARRVKEAIFFQKKELFLMDAPEDVRRFEVARRGDLPRVEVSQEMLKEVLATNGLFSVLEACIAEIEATPEVQSLDSPIDDVLMVGGSTLLPGVYPVFENHFGRDKVRAWQPFEAVCFGACALAAGQFHTSDFIVHDYAFVTYDRQTHEPRYTRIIPRGTRFPSAPDLWKQRLVPTCTLGEPETMFKLVICEVGSAAGQEVAFGWDASGSLTKLEGEDKLIVPLNESNPTLGTLVPPHAPTDRAPRLEIGFGVNEERWLVATVLDLKTDKKLLDGVPVVRLL